MRILIKFAAIAEKAERIGARQALGNRARAKENFAAEICIRELNRAEICIYSKFSSLSFSLAQIYFAKREKFAEIYYLNSCQLLAEAILCKRRAFFRNIPISSL